MPYVDANSDILRLCIQLYSENGRTIESLHRRYEIVSGIAKLLPCLSGSPDADKDYYIRIVESNTHSLHVSVQ